MGLNRKNAKRWRYRIGFLGDKLVKKQAYPRPARQLLGWVSPSLLNSPGLRPELYEAETRPTYGSEAEPYPSSNGAA